MEIMEIAEMLGEAIKNDDRMVRLNNAKNAYDSDVDLNRAMMEYDVQQKALGYEYEKSEKDMTLISQIQSKIDELYKSITENPVFAELDSAQAEVNALMNEVNQKITSTITGVESSCTGSCSSCSGCH
ncbi:MAG: YlbF family regulator [Clostridia bacterium]|nr:YlbF family regulator [Clostridia bacterium]